ncbi:MAG: DNA polymerase III subunit delta [Mariprofundaceae bacterium]
MKVVGHMDIVERFSKSIQAERLHHAWLLHGLKGVGKHTLARELAASYLCEKNAKKSCGQCHACRMFAAGSHPDVFHVALPEDKRDISVGQVRELLAFLALSGAEGERRVVILDNSEHMNIQAANALLKGLEEPATGSLLLITCSDLMRLPATVRSRCLLQHCAPLASDDTRQVLASLPVDEIYMDMAVHLADGCPGTVACLQEKSVAEALLEWQTLTQDVTRADIGKIQGWLQQHISRVPHQLIVAVLLEGMQQLLHQKAGFEPIDRLLSAGWALASWPQAVAKQSLRASPSLLAHILQLRMAARALQ